VETPDFLFTRIQTRIQEKAFLRISATKTALYFAGLSLLIVFNLLAFQQYRHHEQADLLTQLDIAPQNQLYP